MITNREGEMGLPLLIDIFRRMGLENAPFTSINLEESLKSISINLQNYGGNPKDFKMQAIKGHSTMSYAFSKSSRTMATSCPYFAQCITSQLEIDFLIYIYIPLMNPISITETNLFRKNEILWLALWP